MAFKLENVWFASFFLVLVMVIGLDFLGQSMAQYGVSGDTTKMSSITNSLKEVYNPALDAKAQIQGSEITSSDAVNNMVQGAYTGARNNPFTIATIGLNATQTMLEESNLNPNPIFYWIIGAMITTSIVFGIIYLVMRYRVY